MTSDSSRKGPFRFELNDTDETARCLGLHTVPAKTAGARRGDFRTPHGTVETPAFMPVGTVGSVKGLSPNDVRATGSQILLGNTYHLALRPGDALIAEFGGLHEFMRWDGPILTDSGGYQVFSLGELTSVDQDGVTFKSHIDGSPLRLSPERAMEIQLRLGSDIAMVFDECLPHTKSHAEHRRSIETRTHPWAQRCLDLHPRDGRALFAIGQGGLFADLRREHLSALRDLPFDGLAIGGLSVGETGAEFRQMIAVSTAEMPADRPRYLMGVGTVPELIDAIALGVDMFDCVYPTRNARNAMALSFKGPLKLRNAQYTKDQRPLESDCPCYACAGGFSRAYLRHLFQAKEILAATLTSLHNLTFMQRFMQRIREAISSGQFNAVTAELRAPYDGLSAEDGDSEEPLLRT